jgi:transposase
VYFFCHGNQHQRVVAGQAQAAAWQLGISPKLLYRWQQAQLVAKVGSEEVAHDPKVRALRAQLKRAEQELAILKE